MGLLESRNRLRHSRCRGSSPARRFGKGTRFHDLHERKEVNQSIERFRCGQDGTTKLTLFEVRAGRSQTTYQSREPERGVSVEVELAKLPMIAAGLLDNDIIMLGPWLPLEALFDQTLMSAEA